MIAFGHTADDFCESLFRNIMYTGRLSSLPAVTVFDASAISASSARWFTSTRNITRALCGSEGRAGGALRLLAAHRHRAPRHSRNDCRLGTRTSAPAREYSHRHGQHSITGVCSIRAISIRTANPDAETETENQNRAAADSSGSMSEARDAAVIAENQRQIERLSKLGWYHSIELPDGGVIEGHQSVEQLRTAPPAVPHSRGSDGQTRARYRRVGWLVQL